ncbi:MAG: alpha/beta hydrolase [Micromonosporaceae bacterium]
MTSLEDDVAATRRVLDQQDGPTVLVGHSWGGTVITGAGVHPKVAALVYVSALSPDAGETTAQQYEGSARRPPSSSTSVRTGTASSTRTGSRPGSPTTPVTTTPLRRCSGISQPAAVASTRSTSST